MDELDWIERRALESWHQAADTPAREAAGLRWVEIAGGYASVASRLPPSAIVANRAISVGFDRPAEREEITELTALYRDRGVTRYFVQAHPDAARAELGDWLAAEGLEQARGWMKFSRGREAPLAIDTNLTLAKIDDANAEPMGRIIADAFDLGDAAIPWLARLVAHPDWTILGAYDGDSLTAVGGLYVEEGIGWTDMGATAPAFRKRGAQSALLAARIQTALDMGCRIIGTCTGEAVPGDPQHPYSNIKRMGFEERYVRLNYSPPRA